MFSVLRVSPCAVVLSLLASTGGRAQTAADFERLTVPLAQLPTGCRLSPAPTSSVGSGQVRSHPWVGLPIASNPWTGDDRAVVVAIRERLVPSPPLPDGPVPTRGQLARFRLATADDVETAYAAIYVDRFDDPVVVYAITFANAVPAGVAPLSWNRDPGTVRLTSGRTLFVVSGSGECATSAGEHVAGVVRR